MMTIKEFYKWAVKNKVENAHFGISICTDVEYCEEVHDESELEIGGFYSYPEGHEKVEEPFVWIHN